MKLFITKLVFFLILTLITILTFSGVALYAISRASFQVDKKIHILILGDSHTASAIDDSIFKNSINMSGNADSYLYCYIKLKRFLNANHQIDTVFLSFHHSSLSSSLDKWTTGLTYVNEKMPMCLPFITKKDWQLSIMPNLFPFLQHAIHKYARFSLKNGLKSKTTFRELNLGGYTFLNRDKLEKDIQRRKKEKISKYELSKIQVEYLNEIIYYCVKRDVKLVLINTPVYHADAFYNTQAYNDYYNKYLNHVTLMDHSAIILPYESYGDVEHLNYRGAKAYSKMLYDWNPH